MNESLAPQVGMRVVRQLQEFAIASDRFVDATSGRNEMHRTDLHALHLMMRLWQADEPPTASELGARLGLTPAAVTALVDRLENSGHAVRERSDRDRRRVRIAVTDKAKRDGARMFRPMAEALAGVVASYEDHEQRLLSEFLDRVTAVVREFTAGPAEAKET